MFSLTGIQAKIAEYALCAILCFVVYNWIGDRAVSQYKTEQAIAQAKADQVQQAKYNKLAEQYENLKLMRASNAATIQKEVERIIERPVYLSACIDADGLSIINDAIKGGNTNQSTAKMPPDQTP